MDLRLTAALAITSLLAACGGEENEPPPPADGALLLVAGRTITPDLGGNLVTQDTLVVNARDLSAIADLASLKGLLGEPTLTQGSCLGYVAGVPVANFPGDSITGGQLALQGATLDAGPLTVSGATGLGRDISFSFNVDAGAYQGDQGGTNPLFFPGDTLSLAGDGAGVLDGGLAGSVKFPQDVAIIGDINITQGQDAVITWNTPNDPAERVQILLSTFEIDQDRADVLCEAEDTGSFTVPGALTALLSNDELLATVVIARINGADLGTNPDAVVDDLLGGLEIHLEALSSRLAAITVN